MARNAWGNVSRRLTLSSSVRSSHCVAAVWAALTDRATHETRQAAHPLGPHRVAFVRHGRGADLVRFKWLFDLLAMRQQPQIGTELVG